MKIFLLKAKHFFKRNIYPITVTMCTVLVLGIITISAYSAIKKGNVNESVIDTNTPSISENEQISDNNQTDKDNDKGQDESSKPSDDNLNEPSKPVVVDIVFDLPFENAIVSKDYTETTLVYDATTDLWCTHQAIDFACNEGQEVKAVYDGTISKVESSMMYGTVIYLKVSNELTVVYKGLTSDIKIKEGDVVKKGTVLGSITSFLAEKADGIHLHLEVLKNDKLTDPNQYFLFKK